MALHTYRKDIDGLRALAILPVLLYHAGIQGFGGGFVGVDVFFVISGFLITAILAAECEAGKLSILRFYERRIRRIFPALFTVLAATVVGACVFLFPDDLAAFGRSLIAATLFVANITFWNESGYFDTESELKPLLHTWSLSVEEQFYVFFPLLLWALYRLFKTKPNIRNSIIWLGLLGSLAISIYGAHTMTDATFFLLPTRAWEMLVGSVLALGAVPTLKSQKLREAIGLTGIALILYAVFAFTPQTVFPGENALFPCLGAAFLIWSGSGKSPTLTARLLSLTPFVFIGLISYSLYLWHWPVMALTRYATSLHLTPLWQAFTIGASFALAFVSWKFIEAPFRKGNTHPFTRNRARIFTVAGIAMAAAILVGSVLQFTGGLPQRLNETTRTVMAEGLAHDDAIRACTKDREDADAIEPDASCVFGNTSSTVILWGDSHAAALLPALLEAPTRAGQGVRLIAMGGCYPVIGTHLRFSQSDICARHNAATLANIIASPEKTVVLNGRWSTSLYGDAANANPGLTDTPGTILSREAATSLLQSSLAATILALHEAGKTVYIAGAMPEATFDIPRHIGAKLLRNPQLADVRITSPQHTHLRQTQQVMEDVLANAPTVRAIHPAETLCNANGCEIYRGGHLLYADTNHVSTYGAHSLAPLFAEVFAPPAPVERTEP